MNIIIIGFMALLGTLSLISTLAVLVQMFKESGANKRAQIEAERQFRAAVLGAISEGRMRAELLPPPPPPTHNACVSKEPEVVPVVTKIVAPIIEAPVVETPAPVVETPAPIVEAPAPVVEAPAPVVEAPAPVASFETADGTISFAAAQRQTLDEQYLALSKEQKRYYNKIAAYAAGKEGSKCIKNQRYEEYKIGSKRIVRLRIKRGVLHCEFLMINRDLRNHANENKIPLKEAATSIKVTNTETVEMVFSSIDLAIQLIDEERAYKKQLAKERRRQANRAQQ